MAETFPGDFPGEEPVNNEVDFPGEASSPKSVQNAAESNAQRPDNAREQQNVGNNQSPPVEVPGEAETERYEEHHSHPEFMGGDPKQKRTRLTVQQHRQLHRDLNDHLFTKRDADGNHMRPQRGNSGFRIQSNFSFDERLDAMADFYKVHAEKHPESATDFFGQFPHKK